MIQGGDPLSKTGGPRVGTGGPGYKTDCEIRPTLKHGKGALSMAHAGTCEHDASGEKMSGECSNRASAPTARSSSSRTSPRRT
jgi:hypothetical protein